MCHLLFKNISSSFSMIEWICGDEGPFLHLLFLKVNPNVKYCPRFNLTSMINFTVLPLLIQSLLKFVRSFTFIRFQIGPLSFEFVSDRSFNFGLTEVDRKDLSETNSKLK